MKPQPYTPTILTPFVPYRCWYGIRPHRASKQGWTNHPEKPTDSGQRFCHSDSAQYCRITKNSIKKQPAEVDCFVWLCRLHQVALVKAGYTITEVTYNENSCENQQKRA